MCYVLQLLFQFNVQLFVCVFVLFCCFVVVVVFCFLSPPLGTTFVCCLCYRSETIIL